jgi:hypothetical protein
MRKLAWAFVAALLFTLLSYLVSNRSPLSFPFSLGQLMADSLIGDRGLSSLAMFLTAAAFEMLFVVPAFWLIAIFLGWLFGPGDRNAHSRRWKIVLLAAGALLIAFAAGISGTNAYLRRQQTKTEEAWRKFDPSFHGYSPNDSVTSSNETALILERLAVPLGLDLGWREANDRPKPSSEQTREFFAMLPVLSRYLSDEMAKPDESLAQLPTVLNDYLGSHHETLEGIKTVLLRLPRPVWQSGSDRLSNAMMSNVLEQLRLQRLLIVEALLAGSTGDGSGALPWLDASLNLNQSLRSRRQIAFQLISLAVLKLEAFLVRKASVIPLDWRTKLSPDDVQKEFLAGMEGDMWSGVAQVRDAVEVDGKIEYRAAHPFYEIPFSSYYALQISERGLLAVQELSKMDGCTLDPGTFERRIAGSRGLLSIVFEYVGDQWKRLTRTRIDLELSGKILALREARKATGAWPQTIPGGNASAVCPSEHYVYQRLADDRIRLATDPPLPEENAAAIHLSTSYEGR